VSDQPKKFLAIKNWRKYQAIEDDLGRAPWIMDYVDKDADPDRMKLSVFEGGVLDRLYRLRARYARILLNDITWITQATHTPPRDRARIPHAIHTLTERNFIIPTDDGNFEASAAVEVEVKSRGKAKGNPERETGSPLKKEKTSGASERKSEEKSKTNPKKDCGCADGLCDWSEPIPGCSRPESIGDAVYYQRHVKRNEYFTQRLSAGYVREQWKRLLNDTPEDWSYDPDPLFREKRFHLDGGETMVGKEVLRRPKNAKERALLQQNIPHHRKWLYDPACPNHCKKGLVGVLDYPDDPNPTMRHFKSSVECECVTK
jgi:hypothetical protein